MSDTPSDTAPKSAPKKWLYASLALNLLLAGVLVGGIMSGHRHHGPGGPGGPGGGHPGAPPMAVRDIGFAFMKSLPPERRAELMKNARENFKDARPLFEASMQQRKDAIALLEQDTIDPAALKAAFAKVREADTAAQAKAGDAFADMVATLPVAERRDAVSKMRERWKAREAQRMERWDGEGKGKGPDGPGGSPPMDGPPPGPPPHD